MNTLVFKNKVYELQQVNEPKFQVIDPFGEYADIGFPIMKYGYQRTEGLCLNIKGKLYAPKLLKE